jgi:prepilin-type N-terminal cleavage/methylation domain-containing protein/prepilin-type processing-associated H-X9-DG protein
MSRPRFGFTLIELLVVIAIIAILAAILFPVFAKARQKAQQNTCLSNIKEIALSANMYSQDYDQLSPLSGGWGSTCAATWPTNTLLGSNFTGMSAAYNGIAWPSLLQPYMKNYQVYSDPIQADSNVDYELNVGQNGVNTLGVLGTTPCGLDTAGGGGWCSQPGYCWWNYTKLTDSSSKIMFICGTYGGGNGCYAGYPMLATQAALLTGYNATPTSTKVVPHNSTGCNCGYFDGHAAYQTVQSLTSAALENNWSPYT